MENVIKDAEGNLSTIMGKLSEEALKKGQATTFETTSFDCSHLLEKGVKHPNINSNFFNSTISEKNWWEDNKIFLGLILLIALSAFVFYKCFGFLSEKQFPSGYLLFFFGVIAILFIGLVVVAIFMIKASAKYRAEKNERKNKMLAFRLKMLETAFYLDNRKIIAEKHCIENELSMKEKYYLYSLDEKQRASEHNCKIQLKQYEIIEDYMKHMVELAKTGQQNLGDIDLQLIISIFNNEKQPAPTGAGANDNPAAGKDDHDDTDKKTQKQQSASTDSKEKTAQAEGDSTPAEGNLADEVSSVEEL